jgi:hypothetical protein
MSRPCKAGTAMADEKQYTYQDPSRLTLMVKFLTGLLVAIYLIQIALIVKKYMLFADFKAGRFTSQADAATAFQSGQAPIVILATVLAFMLFATTIVFLVWVYRVSANVHAMGAQDLQATAGFSVGMYFIPFYNLAMPPVIMNEIAKASINAGHWQAQKMPAIVPIWWTLQIATIAGSLATTLMQKSYDSTIEGVQFLLLLLVGVYVVNALFHGAQFVLVSGVAKAQRAQQALANVF